MTKKPTDWRRTTTGSALTLYHFPKIVLRVHRSAGWWSWGLGVGNEGVAIGQAGSREEAEQAAVEKVKKMLKEIERACPWQNSTKSKRTSSL